MTAKTKKKPERKEAAKPVKVAAEVKVERFTETLKVALTADEVSQRADRAAQLVAEMDAKAEEFKASKNHAKAIMEGLAAEHRRMSNEVRTRSTFEPVECERVYDYTRNVLTERRTDTGEVLNERPLTEGERQRELPMSNGDGEA